MAKTVAVFQHVSFEDLGSFKSVLIDRGYHIRTYQLGVDELGPVLADQHDLLVVLGGPISVHDEALFPFLHEEYALIRARLLRDAPTLGICLGAQLMAQALGGTIAPMVNKEIGWSPLRFASELAADDPLRELGANAVLHWHGEQFTIPVGAVSLASTAACANQAFAWRKHGLALQFHPEVTARELERWYIGHVAELTQCGVDLHALRADGVRHAPALRAAAGRFFAAWLDARGL